MLVATTECGSRQCRSKTYTKYMCGTKAPDNVYLGIYRIMIHPSQEQAEPPSDTSKSDSVSSSLSQIDYK